MDDREFEQQNHWPDFIPPDFEQAIPSAPKESPVPPPPTVSGPVLPPPAHSRLDPPRARQPRQGAGDRWFNHPSPSGARGTSLVSPSNPAAVTNALIAICVVVWILQNVSSQVNDLVMLIPSIAWQEPWRFITSAFAHMPRSLTHIGFNMLTLLLMGRYLEPLLGHAKFLAVYLTSALGGSAFFVLLAFPPGRGPGGQGLNWNSGMVGASGAVFGLFGAYMVIGWLLRRSLTPMWILLGMNVVVLFLYPGIAWTAHLGGFLTGVGATGAFALDLKRRTAGRSPVGWIGIAAVVCAIVISLVVKYAISL